MIRSFLFVIYKFRFITEKKKEEEEALQESKNNEDGSDEKNVWKETANKMGKVFKSFVKTFDMKG